MKVAIVTSGRFHVGDLARELIGLGIDVTFYSLLPPSRTAALGLPRHACRWLWPAMPVWALHRARPTPRTNLWLVEAVDRAAAQMLERTDHLIIMSGIARHTIARAKSMGAVVHLERSSRHIRSQAAILAAMPREDRTTPSGSLVPPAMIVRELAEYALADEVVVPALHARESFLAEDFPPAKLFVNPFGTNLAQFHPTPAPPAHPPRFVMAGTWSYQKGVDVLLQAFPLVRRRLPDAELHHVGPLGDAPLPRSVLGFTHEDAVPQPALLARYAKAHVFVLASRQEGLAVVQAQALAAGLRLVCTDRTGGQDLAQLAETPCHVVPPDDPAALAEAMITAYEAVAAARDELGERLSRLSWRAYAERWAEHLGATPTSPTQSPGTENGS